MHNFNKNWLIDRIKIAAIKLDGLEVKNLFSVVKARRDLLEHTVVHISGL
jgi:hypothetical protein